MPLTYLDHNATTPPHPDVLTAMAQAAETGWANPASVHAAGRAARRFVDDAREAIATLAAQNARDVLFTSGGTEANNLGLFRPFASLEPMRGLLVTSVLEHPSVVAYAEELARRGVHVAWLPVPSDGRLRSEDIAAILTARDPSLPALVAVHAVHHETGVIQPIADMLACVESYGAHLHVDAVQAAGRVKVTEWHGGHTVALAAHKLRGPKGIGALVTRPGFAPRPILRGGSQERGLRPGTVDPVAAAGFGIASRRAAEGGPTRYAALASLRDEAEAQLVAIGRAAGHTVTPTVATTWRAPHVAHLLVDGWRGDELAAALDLEGVCVSSGSACAAGTSEPSPAITALVGATRARASLRISLGEPSTSADVTHLIASFSRVIGRRSKR